MLFDRLFEQESKRGRPAQVKVTCPHCHGSGKDIVKVPGKTKPFEKPCPVCGGKGYIVKQEFKPAADKKPTNEQAPANSMGVSGSESGAVQTYDPGLRKRNAILRRKTGPGIGRIGEEKYSVVKDFVKAQRERSNNPKKLSPYGKKQIRKSIERLKKFRDQQESKRKTTDGRSAA